MFETKQLSGLEQELNTNLKTGLSSEEAKLRLEKNGKNKLAEKKKKSFFFIFLSQLNNPMIYVLFATMVISTVITIIEKSNDYTDIFIILAVILLNGIIGAVQESKAEKSLEALKKLSSPTATVLRDNQIIEIAAEDLVIGDVVILEEGRTVPADIRLIESFSLKSDESSLTGESTAIEKDASIIFSEEVGIGDRINMVYMSTPIVYGHGRGVVCSIGMDTEIGKIATLLTETTDNQTPLQKKLAQLSKFLGLLAIIIVTVIFLVSLIQQIIYTPENVKWTELLLSAIALAVAAVPEGLPAVVTIVLAMGVTKMVKVNTIVRKLPSVETIGSVNVVCSDKTGTLTQNKMTVVETYTPSETLTQEKFNENKNNILELATGMCLCSNASVEGGVYGDPTEVALVEFASVIGLSKQELESRFPRINEIPFDSVRKMMSTQHEYNNKKIVYTKGALDQILNKTTHIQVNDQIKKITDEDIKSIEDCASEMANRALRVLALAKHETDEIDENNLIFIGLVAMIDPARKEAKPAVDMFKKASIITVMITGDHKDTAFAIAKELGICEEKNQCMSGAELDLLTEDELCEIVKTTRVFARVSPENKVSIVKAFKKNGNIVAMTGDGVNDAPSLKTADIGIAMGITGTDVSKGAADIVLTDDNFASIEKAVEEGRNIYANIKKTILFLLSSNFGEVIVMSLTTFLFLPVPLLPTHLLWVNLITDSLPAMALGNDPKDAHIMEQKPRDPKEGLFANKGLLNTIFYGVVIGLITLIAFIYFPIVNGNISPFAFSEIKTYFMTNPDKLAEARTCAFTILGLSQLFHMIGISDTKHSFIHVFKKKNWLMLVAFLLGLLLQIAVVEVSFLNDWFNTVPLRWDGEIWIILAVSTTPLLIHEIIVFVKWIYSKFTKK